MSDFIILNQWQCTFCKGYFSPDTIHCCPEWKRRPYWDNEPFLPSLDYKIPFTTA